MKKLLFVFFWILLLGPERFVKMPENASSIEQAFREVFLTYPELQDKKIHLVFHNGSGSLMQAWPTFEPNTYLVFVSVNPKYREFLSELTLDQFHGWLAHEFGHIVDYKNRSQLGKAWFILKYLFSAEFQRKSETFADYQAIYHGYGPQLKSGVEHSLRSDKMPIEVKQKLQSVYPGLDELQKLIQENEGLKK